MATYHTVAGESYVSEGRRYYIGMRLALAVQRKFGWITTRTLAPGSLLTVKNIVYQEEHPNVVFLACEFETHIGGHTCSAERRNAPPWESRFLCRDGYGEWMTIPEANKCTEEVDTKPDWEV